MENIDICAVHYHTKIVGSRVKSNYKDEVELGII